jgi:hypothetical protein
VNLTYDVWIWSFKEANPFTISQAIQTLLIFRNTFGRLGKSWWISWFHRWARIDAPMIWRIQSILSSKFSHSAFSAEEQMAEWSFEKFCLQQIEKIDWTATEQKRDCPAVGGNFWQVSGRNISVWLDAEGWVLLHQESAEGKSGDAPRLSIRRDQFGIIVCLMSSI